MEKLITVHQNNVFTLDLLNVDIESWVWFSSGATCSHCVYGGVPKSSTAEPQCIDLSSISIVIVLGLFFHRALPGELMMELNSNDAATLEEAVAKADRFLQEEKSCKSAVNRTVINKSHSSECGSVVNIGRSIVLLVPQHRRFPFIARCHMHREVIQCYNPRGNRVL